MKSFLQFLSPDFFIYMWFNRLLRLSRDNNDPQSKEIITREEIIDLITLFNQKKVTLNNNKGNAHRQGQGDSNKNGQGLDYKESRSYSPGDEKRAINWKQSARSQKLVVNNYIFEPDIVDCIVIDARSGMFFGTVRQPKIKLAVKVLIKKAVESLSCGRYVEIVFVNSLIEQTPLIINQSQLINIIESIVDGLESIEGDVPLDHILHFIATRKSNYANIYLVSDFNGLDEKTLPLITALSSGSDLEIYNIIDAIEQCFPAFYPYEVNFILQDSGNIINNRQAALNIKELVEHNLKNKSKLLKSTGCLVKPITTAYNDDSLASYE